jgi:hypothetical protein
MKIQVGMLSPPVIVKKNSPSVPDFPRVPKIGHSGKNYTQEREAFPSVAECPTLREERHSAKALFPEYNT